MEIALRTIIGTLTACAVTATLVMFMVSTNPSALIIITLAVCAALLPLLFIRPEIGLALLIITRNVIDIFDQAGASVGSAALNIASLLGILIIPWAGIVIFRELSYSREGIAAQLRSIPLLPLWLTLIVVALISLRQSADIVVSVTHIVKLLNYVVLYVAGFVLAQRIGVRKMFAVLASALVIPSILGVYQLATSTSFTAANIIDRLHGTFAHPNAFAFALVIGIVSAITLFTPAHAKKKLGWFLLGGLFTVMLLFTYTRSAWIGITIAGLIWMIGYYRKLILPATVTCAILVLSFPALATYSQQTFGVHLEDTSLVQRAGISNDEGSESFAWRLRTWEETLPAVWEAPVLGHGIGMFQTVRQRFVGFDTDLRSLAAHNDYLKLAVELGLLGLGLYLLLFARIAGMLFSRMTDAARAQPYLVGYAAILIAMLVMSMSDNILRNAPVQWMFWSLTGVMMAAISVSRSSRLSDQIT